MEMQTHQNLLAHIVLIIITFHVFPSSRMEISLGGRLLADFVSSCFNVTQKLYEESRS